jgi:hypothetical protein
MYSLSNAVWMIKSRRTRWLELVARMGERMVHAGFWWGNLGGK